MIIRACFYFSVVLVALSISSAIFAAACSGCANAPPPNPTSTVTVDTTVCVLSHYSDAPAQLQQECAPISVGDAQRILDAASAMAERKSAGEGSVQP
jgi:hypothetical protein